MGQTTRVTLADKAADALLERVRSHEWPLGAKLPGESTLAPQLGVGRSTVREAIRQLAGQGVLMSRQGAGVFVAALDVVEDWETVLERADIIEVIEGRIAIESESAALAAERRTPQDLRAIRRALADRQEYESMDEHVDADTRFHRSVVAAAHNDVLLEMFDRFVPRIREAMIAMMRIRCTAGTPEDHAMHDALVDAIAERDSQQAGHTSREHLTSLKEGLQGV